MNVVPPPTLAEVLNAVIAKVAENAPAEPGDCERVAEAIAVLSQWYSQKCPGV